jgi:hypothetical protein
MSKGQGFTPPIPIEKRIFSFIMGVVLYPYNVIKKYNDYNIRITEIANELKDSSIFRIKKNNIKLIFFFIQLPILLGILFFIYSCYQNQAEIYKFYKIITFENKHDPGIFGAINFSFRKIKYAISEFPIKSNQLSLLGYAYLLSILGSRFLSLHPAFKKEEEIKTIFGTLGYIDGEGHPWRVTWTPDAIQIISFNCDPIQLCSNTRIWSTINFPPGTPRVSKSNMNKFIVTRAYELSSNIVFSYN